MSENINPYELSTVTTYRKEIWNRFVKGINTYKLIEPNDKIAVCISGGKDSMLMAVLMKRLQRYSKFPFEVEYLVMDPGYNAINRRKIEDNAKLLDIPIRIFETQIFDAVAAVDNNPCYLCARMRRGHLYKTAKELGCNKISLGHHFNDVTETILMGMLWGSQVQTMMPKIHSENYEGMQLNCTMCDNGGGGSKREEIKKLIKQLKKTNPEVDKHIFRSVENVNLQTIISYHRGDEYHHFLDDFDEGRSVRGTKHDIL
ncbi:tRNA 2-thiocytidine biosynthesis TtcA family protein [uncultured Ruminococcus sp.]|uniref:tRNA 2-thiocytidine biosynthesis TtcA family protein n=1 Tax=uncultured Ruminococcus sp. TaxID=165186 RepID=UPI0025DA3780|nr:tRNA 2-thiocytidine biosynthesis TtcA family protein [uncultured Ruminococcus sp.]